MALVGEEVPSHHALSVVLMVRIARGHARQLVAGLGNKRADELQVARLILSAARTRCSRSGKTAPRRAVSALISSAVLPLSAGRGAQPGTSLGFRPLGDRAGPARSFHRLFDRQGGPRPRVKRWHLADARLFRLPPKAKCRNLSKDTLLEQLRFWNGLAAEAVGDGLGGGGFARERPIIREGCVVA